MPDINNLGKLLSLKLQLPTQQTDGVLTQFWHRSACVCGLIAVFACAAARTSPGARLGSRGSGPEFGRSNALEQGHRTVKKRAWLAMGYRSLQSAGQRLQGIKTMSRLGNRVRWLVKGDPAGQAISASLYDTWSPYPAFPSIEVELPNRSLQIASRATRRLRNLVYCLA